MGCIWSSEPSNRCLVCNCKESRDSCFIDNKCRHCALAVQPRRSSITYFGHVRYSENISNSERSSISNVNRRNVRGVLPQPRPNPTSDKPQFGKYYCKPCGHSWKSLRSWSTKYQMCKRCHKPVYPHKLRELLPSDYTSTTEDPKEHEMELCQMCKQLGYSCKNYNKQVNRWK